MSLIIRNGRKDDFDFILNGVREVVRMYRCMEELPPPFPNAREAYNDMLNDPQHHHILVAESNGKKVGTVLVSFSKAVHYGGVGAEVQDLYVDPSARNLGVGKALLKKVDEIAKERNVTGAHLCQPPPGSELDEERSLFYKKQGFHLGGFTRHKLYEEGLIYNNKFK